MSVPVLRVLILPEEHFGAGDLEGALAREFREAVVAQMGHRGISRKELAKRINRSLRTVERFFSSASIRRHLARNVAEALLFTPAELGWNVGEHKANRTIVPLDERGRGLGRLLTLSRDSDIFEYPELGSARLIAAAYGARLVEEGRISPDRENEFADCLVQTLLEAGATVSAPIGGPRRASKRAG